MPAAIAGAVDVEGPADAVDRVGDMGRRDHQPSRRPARPWIFEKVRVITTFSLVERELDARPSSRSRRTYSA